MHLCKYGYCVLVVVFAAAHIANSAVLNDTIAAKAVPKGHAAWLYPENQQQIDTWKANLTAYNTAAGPQRAIRVLYVYSKDLYISNPILPFNISAITDAAARAFRSIPYVTHISAIVDGWYSDYSDYDSGDLFSLNKTQLESLADMYAKVYCASTAFDGVQLDLEPFNSKNRDVMLIFAKRLALGFRNTAVCRTPSYGKALSFFAGPRQADAALYNALGPNGYVVVSGYDLDSPGPGLPETPQQYRTNLASVLAFVKTAAAQSKYGRYSVGLPFAASACEFEKGISLTDPSRVIQGYPMYSATLPANASYVPTAFDVLNKTLGAADVSSANSRFLGVSMWAFLSRDVKVAGYRHEPKNAFDTPGMVTYLTRSMPVKNT